MMERLACNNQLHMMKPLEELPCIIQAVEQISRDFYAMIRMISSGTPRVFNDLQLGNAVFPSEGVLWAVTNQIEPKFHPYPSIMSIKVLSNDKRKNTNHMSLKTHAVIKPFESGRVRALKRESEPSVGQGYPGFRYFLKIPWARTVRGAGRSQPTNQPLS